MKFVWKITELKSVGDELTAKYHAFLIDDITIETEGYWTFIEPRSLDGATEETVAGWIENETSKDGVSSIKSRLLEQLNAVKSSQDLALPWRPPTFKPNL
jgi:hypothetical protein